MASMLLFWGDFDRVEQGRFQMQPFAVDQSKVLIRLNLDASLTDAFWDILDGFWIHIQKHDHEKSLASGSG